MIYWLFTEGRAILSALFVLLLCAAPILLLITASVLGTGIRRAHDDRAKTSLLERILMGLSYTAAMLTVTAIYLNVFGSTAIQQRQAPTNAVIAWIVGAPSGVSATRLFLFSVILVFLLLVTAISLHSLLQNGGVLREQIDRLRMPRVKRGALGSSRFCTLRKLSSTST